MNIILIKEEIMKMNMIYILSTDIQDIIITIFMKKMITDMELKEVVQILQIWQNLKE